MNGITRITETRNLRQILNNKNNQDNRSVTVELLASTEF